MYSVYNSVLTVVHRTETFEIIYMKYIEGYKYKIYDDHNNYKYLIKSSKKKKM